MVFISLLGSNFFSKLHRFPVLRDEVNIILGSLVIKVIIKKDYSSEHRQRYLKMQHLFDTAHVDQHFQSSGT